MKSSSYRTLVIGLSVLTAVFHAGTFTAWAQTDAHGEAAGGPKVIFEPGAPASASQITINGKDQGDVTFNVTATGIDVTVNANPKTGFPGIVITPPTPWNVAGYGHIEMRVTNQGTKSIRPSLRLDNAGPWQENRNSGSTVTIKPGETKTLATIFGYSYGKPAYALDPAAIISALVFTGKSDVETKYHIEQIQASGPTGEKPFVDPNTVSVKPVDGVLFGGRTATVDASRQLVAKAGAKGSLAADGKSIQLDFPGGAQDQIVTLKPAVGQWRLSDFLQVRVRLKNTGNTPVTPGVRLEGRGGMAPVVSAKTALAPGAETELLVPFAAGVSWVALPQPEEETKLEFKKEFSGSVPGTGTRYTSNSTTGISFVQGKGSAPASYAVTGIVADLPRADLPAWLGKRPPVDGEWVKSFEDNFDGTTINLHTWNIYTTGAWHLGASTHYSRDGLIVKDGKLALRVEKKHGHHNDNPDYPANDHQTGWADTQGKWTQRYGYFEARMKLPTAPNMFLAFWLMPDRDMGKSREPRNTTKEGGMEFDIMESLSIWGPWRYDFGMHWDGYQKYHKSNGMFTGYCTPDKEGFITVGMLWTPGVVVNYANGKEMSRWESPRVGSVPEYMILDHVLGGWETEPVDDSKLPADFVIDYIRVWQRKDLASAADGPKPNDGGPLPPGQSQATAAAK